MFKRLWATYIHHRQIAKLDAAAFKLMEFGQDNPKDIQKCVNSAKDSIYEAKAIIRENNKCIR